MTYQQLFDDLIGETPLSTVDVDRVIGRQRRARRLRIGAGTTAVAAAVALVVFGTTGLIGKPHAQPARPTPTVTTVPGSDRDLDRIDAAVVAALLRMEPALSWAEKGNPAGTVPNWESRPAGASLASGYRGEGQLRIGGVDLFIGVQITRDGATAWEREGGRSCSKNAVECGERTGPHRERMRYQRSVWQQEVPPRLRAEIPERMESADVTILRGDGSLIVVSAGTTGEDSRLPLTVDQLTTVALDPAIVLGPAPSASPGPSSTVRTVAGSQQDAVRLDEALTAALGRQAAGFTWTTKWGGKDSPMPVGFAPKGRLNVNAPVLDAASFRVGDRAGQLSMRLLREGRAAWENASPCPTAGLAGRNCTVTEGPGGERVRARRLLKPLGAPGDRPTLGQDVLVEVLRSDGTLVYLYVSQPVLSTAQLIAVARDPALTLAPPPPGPGTNQVYGLPDQFYGEAERTAAVAALDDVSPAGTIYLGYPAGGSFDGLIGASEVAFPFLVQRSGLAGDGEIIVQRRMGSTLTCSNVRSLSSRVHEGHPHDGECSESTRPDGNRVVSLVSRSSGTVTYDVFVQRPDRGTVEVVLDNRPNTGSATDMPKHGEFPREWPKGNRGGATPPLTLDEVTSLSGHPDLINLLP
ncbi:hypothetical protein DLE60_23305 [Micromonospora globispora]|uniref:Uncharacterized protein n=1 Tax=Micromonospora globispora TaxID=1450148 RepID=A0A317JY22_9ACTN|nr:hypothetical protein [Micromonospora globispora]PWU45465.1 hypothetical protein DLJ46_21265 [Micromonospora globispora]PWU58050.1 hypothetical protein DLE60_23305 [Micromonospora globispora]